MAMRSLYSLAMTIERKGDNENGESTIMTPTTTTGTMIGMMRSMMMTTTETTTMKMTTIVIVGTKNARFEPTQRETQNLQFTPIPPALHYHRDPPSF